MLYEYVQGMYVCMYVCMYVRSIIVFIIHTHSDVHTKINK